jgi:Type II site-specific deoxyribonuclease
VTAPVPPTLPPLTVSQKRILARIAGAFQVPVDSEATPTSDLATDAFMEDFANRLIVWHALNADPLKKKAFEYAFAASCRNAGRNALVIANPVHPGQDVMLDGIAFSCKTEAEAKISQKKIKISKLMEARWIRECTTSEQFATGVLKRVIHHLDQYERMVTLRAFKRPGPIVEYHLIEIPLAVLRRASTLTAKDFGPRTKNGSSKAVVLTEDGKPAFTLTLDGSVEKVTVNCLNAALCRPHARWSVPIIDDNSDDEESAKSVANQLIKRSRPSLIEPADSTA